MWRGRLHVGIVPAIASDFTSMTASALSFSLETNAMPVSLACTAAAIATKPSATAVERSGRHDVIKDLLVLCFQASCRAGAAAPDVAATNASSRVGPPS